MGGDSVRLYLSPWGRGSLFQLYLGWHLPWWGWSLIPLQCRCLGLQGGKSRPKRLPGLGSELNRSQCGSASHRAAGGTNKGEIIWEFFTCRLTRAERKRGRWGSSSLSRSNAHNFCLHVILGFTDFTYYIEYYTALWVHECVFAEEAV